MQFNCVVFERKEELYYVFYNLQLLFILNCVYLWQNSVADYEKMGVSRDSGKRLCIPRLCFRDPRVIMFSSLLCCQLPTSLLSLLKMKLCLNNHLTLLYNHRVETSLLFRHQPSIFDRSRDCSARLKVRDEFSALVRPFTRVNARTPFWRWNWLSHNPLSASST